MALSDAVCGKSEVGERLRRALAALGLKQAEVARAFGVDRGRLDRGVSGDHFPSLPFLAVLCDRYGFTMDWFYRGVVAGVPHGLVAALQGGSISPVRAGVCAGGAA